VSNLLVDSGHQAHVGLAPLPAQVPRLHLEQLERVQLQHDLLDAQDLLEDGRRLEDDEHHDPGALVLGELVQDAQQVDAGEDVAPPDSRRVAVLELLGVQLGLLADHAVGKVQVHVAVLGLDEAGDVQVEELEDERHAVGEQQVLARELELVDVVDLEVLEHEEQDGRDGLDEDLLVAVRVYAEFDCEEVRAQQVLGKEVRHDLQRVVFGPRLRH